jgi:predicted nicotinamide N-methyase
MARHGLDKSMSAPISLGGLFPDSSDEEGGGGFCNDAEESVVTLGGVAIRLRERPFHPLNANAVWPGAHALAEWVRANAADKLAPPRRVLELGAATGALAIFCVRACGLDVTTSDVDDGEVEQQVADNFRLNGLQPPPHLAHTWGTPLPLDTPRFDVVLASDILLYVRAYPALVDTLEALCAPRAGVPVRDMVARPCY